jgi:hypothetical protein
MESRLKMNSFGKKIVCFENVSKITWQLYPSASSAYLISSSFRPLILFQTKTVGDEQRADNKIINSRPKYQLIILRK